MCTPLVLGSPGQSWSFHPSSGPWFTRPILEFPPIQWSLVHQANPGVSTHPVVLGSLRLPWSFHPSSGPWLLQATLEFPLLSQSCVCLSGHSCRCSYWHCVRVIPCVCTYVHMVLCACFCHALYENVCSFLYCLYACIPLICIIMGICALYFFFKL